MNKKSIIKIVFAILVIAVVGLFYKAGSQYYESRYVASNTYYLKVPKGISMEIEDLYDDTGKAVDKGKAYDFKAMDRDGKIKNAYFEIVTSDSEKLLKPETYLEITASETINLSEKRISKEDVPKEIVDKIENLND